MANIMWKEQEWSVSEPVTKHGDHDTCRILTNTRTQEQYIITERDLNDLSVPKVELDFYVLCGKMFNRLPQDIVMNEPAVFYVPGEPKENQKELHTAIMRHFQKSDFTSEELDDQRKVLFFPQRYNDRVNLRQLTEFNKKHNHSHVVNPVETCDQVIRLLDVRTKLGWDLYDLVKFVNALRSAYIKYKVSNTFNDWIDTFDSYFSYGLNHHEIRYTRFDGKLEHIGINFYNEERYKRVNKFDMSIDPIGKRILFDRRITFELDKIANYDEFLPNIVVTTET